MALADKDGRPLLSYLCDSCIDRDRGDVLYLGQVSNGINTTRKQLQEQRNVLEACQDFLYRGEWVRL